MHRAEWKLSEWRQFRLSFYANILSKQALLNQ